MQFLVFAAFAAVLSIPADGLPWSVSRDPLVTWGSIVGQVLLVAGLAAWFARRVTGNLDRDSSSIGRAQWRFGQGHFVTRVVLKVCFLFTLTRTDWSERVRAWSWLPADYGLDELIMLAPFLACVIVSWIMLYPADRALKQVSLEMRLWASAASGHGIWTRWQYLGFMFRQHVLIIALPMIPIVMGNDILHPYRNRLADLTGLPYMQDVLVGGIAGFVFLLAPVAMRYTWHTRVLPSGELRQLLERLCRRVGLTYHRILVWQTDGMVVNAAVMGIVRPVRYILLSDGLLEMMEDRKIEAVFGHEAGHVKLWHIPFFLLFALVSMFTVGGIMELVMFARHQRPDWFAGIDRIDDYLQVAGMALVVIIWALGFGVVSRRFEWQADLFGARCVTPPASRCDRPCRYHGTAEETTTIAAPLRVGSPSGSVPGGAGLMGSGGQGAPPDTGKGSTVNAVHPENAAFLAALARHQAKDAELVDRASAEPASAPSAAGTPAEDPADPPPPQAMTDHPLCASAAEQFSGALYHIAMLNGIPIEAPSWRHSSIANRMHLLRAHAATGASVRRLQRQILIIKSLLVAGTAIGVIVGAWLYWPR